ncbi:MAG: DUF1611 domain-containing protein [Deltaproteobacteria bacterium]|nr:DUF1611 domain-containing protein [Deltaproteobacteria bacterium]
MSNIDGNAIVYCEGAFNTPNGKTAHGLVRFTERYRVLGVVDSTCSVQDAGEILDGRPKGVPIYGSVAEAIEAHGHSKTPASHLVVGIAPDGGRLGSTARKHILEAIEYGLNVDAGLHDFLSEDPQLTSAARRTGARIRDIRKPPPRDQLHFFTGKIQDVKALKVAVLGTDSAIGKRTTAWILVHGLQEMGIRSAFVGTGQTAWLQGARHCIVLDSLINDFVSGEIEHVVWEAFKDGAPQVIVIEGQGSLMNPAYPGGFEILAAARPDAVILQHAPARAEYDGFPGYPIHPIEIQIQSIELLSGKPVRAITINHEGLERDRIPAVCRDVIARTGRPSFDVLLDGARPLIESLRPYLDDKG